MECHTETSALPTRALEIRSVKGKYDIRRRLSHGMKAEYVALSHCWGSRLPLTPTKSTLEERQRGISWSSLPRTFRDAICITYLLGHRFLWIDALCILQDDEEDWQREASRMHDVYRNGIFTISADHAGDGSGGCFSNIPSRFWDVILPNEGPAGIVVHQFDSTEHVELDHTGPNWNHSKSLSPLSGRAWTLQERLLPPRLLHYMKGDLIWECKEDVRCLHGATIWNSIKVGIKDGSKFSRTSFSSWYDLVHEYSNRKMTKGTDKLIAVSGLAQEFENKSLLAKQEKQRSTAGNLEVLDVTFLGRYLAGLWENDILKGLCWSLQDDPCERPLEKIAPSWSWASVRGKVAWDSDFDATRRIIHCSCQPAGLDPYGSVMHGEITLFTCLERITIRDYPAVDPSGPRIFGHVSGLAPDSCHVKFDTSTDALDLLDGPESSITVYAVMLSSSYALAVRESPFHPGSFERFGLIEAGDQWDVPTDEIKDLTAEIFADSFERLVALV